MSIAHPTRSHHTGGGPGWHFTEWFFGIIGGIAAFLGLFTLFAGDDSSIGLGGEWSWRVDEISSGWSYGLVIGGAVLVLAAILMAVLGRNRTAPVETGDRATSDVIWHAGMFVVVNAFVWAQDYAIGGGLDYAYWMTIPWGIGLAIHIIAYLSGRSRKAEM